MRIIPALFRLAACLLLACLLMLCSAEEEGSAEYHPASCEAPAYWLREDPDTGIVTIEDDGEPLGHDWENLDSDTRRCRVCGKTEAIRWEDTPQVRIHGSLEGIGKKERVLVPVSFISREMSFDCYGYMSIQGHSTLNLSKQNYTLRLYDDAELTQKHSVSFDGRQLEHKYILKAYWGDSSISRDLVCADIWADITASRKHVPTRLLQSSHFGAVAGFPVTVWLEGEFLGLYTMNLHKDNDLYVMSKRDREAIMVCNACTMPEALFREEAAYEENVSDWEIELAGADESWVRGHFNDLIRFVMTSSDEEFRGQLENYLDVEAAVDYLLFIWSMGLKDSGAKDLVMLTYGGEWIPTAYDMEEGIGLICAPEEFLPVLGTSADSATGSLLWDRLTACFSDELQARYRYLRQDILSEQKLLSRLEAFWNSIPDIWRQRDLAAYPGRTPSRLEDMEAFLCHRLPLLDAVLLA